MNNYDEALRAKIAYREDGSIRDDDEYEPDGSGWIYFLIIVSISLIVALAALVADVKQFSLAGFLDYEACKKIFANCFLYIIHALFIDYVKSFMFFNYIVSGFFLGFGSYLIWAS